MNAKIPSLVTFENLPQAVSYLQEQNNQILDCIAEIKDAIHIPSTAEYYSRQDIANLLKVNISTINNWVKKGKITSYGIGNRVLFKKNEIELALTKISR
jgi:excisionase family DNA binding protein